MEGCPVTLLPRLSSLFGSKLGRKEAQESLWLQPELCSETSKTVLADPAAMGVIREQERVDGGLSGGPVASLKLPFWVQTWAERSSREPLAPTRTLFGNVKNGSCRPSSHGCN